MYFVNPNYQQLSIEDIKADLQNLDDVPVLSEDELEQELGNYYNQALQAEANRYQFNIQFESAAIEGFFPGIGHILQSIREFVCRVINATSTRDEIIDAILDAISGIIPGGIFIGAIVKKIVKYILDKGFDLFCPAPVII